MTNKLKWSQLVGINFYWLGINIASGVITPVLLPYLVVLFMPPAYKTTYLATVRTIGLAVAMLIQPLAGMISDQSQSRWGRRTPFIFGGALLNIVFLAVVGLSIPLMNAESDVFFLTNFQITTSFAVLIAGIVLLQLSSNIGQGAMQGVIPDVVPVDQRGKASGIKSVMELLPAFLIILVGPLVDSGRIWETLGLVMVGFAITMLVTVGTMHEKPWKEQLKKNQNERFLRILGLTALFVLVSQLAVWLVKTSQILTTNLHLSPTLQIILVGLVGLIGMAGAILVGVYLGAWMGIGKEARGQKSFIWWVVNRLMFLAAIGSIQGFAQYYLRDVVKVPNPATMATILLGIVALFLIPSAIIGGNYADRFGKIRFLSIAGFTAGIGTAFLLLSTNMAMIIASGCVLGIATGLFMACSWALGTDLAPKSEAGRYLGISNLAGAGAGIVGAGIGGPLADYFNTFQPGMGYLIIFSLYGLLFLISVLPLRKIQIPVALEG